MQTDRLEIPTSQGPIVAAFAAPDGWASGPGVVVVQEWWGVDDHIGSIARRLADDGFAALAPDLYHGKQVLEPDDARKLAMALDEDEAVETLRSAVTWLLERSATSVGITGFCMGGGLAWEVAFVDGRVGASVPFYGSCDPKGRSLLAPVQAHYGSEDRFSDEMLDEARSVIASKEGSEFWWYEGAHHAFMNDTRPSYSAEAAALAWERMIGFFRTQLRSA